MSDRAQLHFNVSGSTISRVDTFYVVEKSRNYLYAWFNGGDTAVFIRDGQTYEVALVDGECEVPEEVIANLGRFDVKAKTNGTETLNSARVYVHESGYKAEGSSTRKYIADEIERLRAKLAAVYGNINDRITELERRTP